MTMRGGPVTNGRGLGYVPALDGLRGVAIALVLATHYFGLPGAGASGVGLFFVLSGFLITTLLIEERADRGSISLGNFYRRRARRLLPALALLLATYLIVRGAQGQNGLRVVALAGLYFGNVVQAFSLHDNVGGTSLAHLWSLAEEEQFYLVWPLVLLAVTRARRPLLWVAGLVVALTAYRAALATGGGSVTRLYYGPDTHADWLLGGALLAFAGRRRIPEPVVLAAFGLLVAGTTVNPWTRAWETWQATVLMLGCVVLVAAASAKTPLAEVLSVRPLVGLGKISYSVYLWHIPVFAALDYRHPLAAIPLTLLAAILSYHFVEQPFRRRRARVSPLLASARA
jgi:peptidoglycan/LPS O-acetylase OafA/YrhL